MYESVKKRRCRSNIGTGPCVAIAESDTEARPETEFCWSIRTGLFVGSNSERKHARSQHVTESPVPGRIFRALKSPTNISLDLPAHVLSS